MYVLISKTPNCAISEAASESKETLIKVLRQMAKDFVTQIYCDDEDLLCKILEDINNATKYWCDEDEEYPYSLQIQKVKLI